MNPRRAPQPIRPTHALDETADLWIELWPSGAPALPAPVEPESLAMPLDNGLRLNDVKALSPAKPNAR